ncbi:hypothetical protein O6H91_13G025400 [Diphasiastrum complanatum]|uniref:Uncharacterized protein n=1 Tax=Diphasiastrum complanatum TaxID=34168 RepID=A0ACC2BTE1_DIPCM|nr:hypothetical protein O6H91_13G025400 [Diphasiastrum complanatum]
MKTFNCLMVLTEVGLLCGFCKTIEHSPTIIETFAVFRKFSLSSRHKQAHHSYIHSSLLNAGMSVHGRILQEKRTQIKRS